MRQTFPLPSPRFSLHRHNGGVLPVVIVVLALAISVVIFFVFTRPALEKSTGESVTESAKTPQSIAEKAPVKPVPPTTPPVAPPPPTPPAKPIFGFARPLDLGKEMVRSLSAGDYTRAGDLAAASDPTQAKNAADIFQKILKSLSAKVGIEDEVELLGLVENKTRIAIPFTLPGMQDPVHVQLDLEKDDKMGWKVARLLLPKEFSTAVTAQPEPASANSMPATVTKADEKTMPKAVQKNPLISVEETPDALTFGSDFVRALLKHDFITALKFVDENKVPSERLAGLCIVFEEGEYEFKPTKPLIITVANPEVSWVIAQVQSQKLQQSTEFGLEMQRSGVDQPWKIVGLNLSEILSSFASSAAKVGVPYTPIVNNPKGGESLALYFEYDQAQLHPRALKQLEIVAGLLKSDPSKKLQIAGHTDAKGTDNYNLNLSQARADSVKKQLASLGVAEEQIVTTGMGKAQPLSPNQKADGTDDPEGRSKNRRAEIYLDF